MQYWEAWYADGSVVTSDDCLPEEVPQGKIMIILQPGAYERVGWNDRLLNTDHVFFRTDLDCWTEHREAVAALDEMMDHAHVIACYRRGKYQGNFKNEIRPAAESRYQELMSGNC